MLSFTRPTPGLQQTGTFLRPEAADPKIVDLENLQETGLQHSQAAMRHVVA